MTDNKKRKADSKSSLAGPVKKVAGEEEDANGNMTMNTENGGDTIHYDPVHFIRSHSKNNDPADIQTQIWEVVFEPDPNDPKKTTNLVATCGGNTICLIDVNAGTPVMKYKHKDVKENFYTLAWTTMTMEGAKEKNNVLASGGTKGEIRLYHPKNRVCFYEFKTVDKKSVAINSLIFHSENPSWLFCGTSDGHVTLWDVGTPSLPSYDGAHSKKLLSLFPDYGDVYNITWTGANRWLLAGTAAGLVGWNIEDKKVQKDYKPVMVDFILPESPRDEGENPVVDSLDVATEWNVVSKCALHGLIYVFDLKATIKEIGPKMSEASKGTGEQTGADGSPIIEQDVKMLAKLKWSDTDNFYMNLGCHKGTGLVCCGDDKGSLWLYNLPQYGKDSAKPTEDEIQATARLYWPELQDDQLENSRKVPLDKHDIIIDKVAASHDNNHVVAVTSNNMVCIWRRTSGELNDGGGDELQ